MKGKVCCEYCDEVVRFDGVEAVQCTNPKCQEMIPCVYPEDSIKDIPVDTTPKKKGKKGACDIARAYFKTVKKKFRKGKITRAEIIVQCVEDGVNPATAATQWSKFKKANNL